MCYSSLTDTVFHLGNDVVSDNCTYEPVFYIIFAPLVVRNFSITSLLVISKYLCFFELIEVV